MEQKSQHKFCPGVVLKPRPMNLQSTTQTLRPLALLKMWLKFQSIKDCCKTLINQQQLILMSTNLLCDTGNIVRFQELVSAVYRFLKALYHFTIMCVHTHIYVCYVHCLLDPLNDFSISTRQKDCLAGLGMYNL